MNSRHADLLILLGSGGPWQILGFVNVGFLVRDLFLILQPLPTNLGYSSLHSVVTEQRTNVHMRSESAVLEHSLLATLMEAIEDMNN